MALQVQFSGLAPTNRTVELSEEDLATVYDIVVTHFLSTLPFIDLSSRTAELIPERKVMSDFLDRFGVSVDYVPGIESFFRAALGKPKN